MELIFLQVSSSFLTTEMEAVNAASVVALELIKEQAAALDHDIVEKDQENPQTAGATEPGHATVSLRDSHRVLSNHKFLDTSNASSSL